MKKFVIIFCAVLVINLGHCDADESEIIPTCQAQEQVTDNDLLDFKNFHIDPESKSKNVKCLAACIFEKLGWIAGNKVDIAAIEKYVEIGDRDQQVVADDKARFNECKSVTDQDRCEMAAKFAKCMGK